MIIYPISQKIKNVPIFMDTFSCWSICSARDYAFNI